MRTVIQGATIVNEGNTFDGSIVIEGTKRDVLLFLVS